MKKIKKVLTVIGICGLITTFGLVYTGCAKEKTDEEGMKKEAAGEVMQDTTMQDTTAVDTM